MDREAASEEEAGAVAADGEGGAEAKEGEAEEAGAAVPLRPVPVWDRERWRLRGSVSARPVDIRSRMRRDNLVQSRNVPNAGQP